MGRTVLSVATSSAIESDRVVQGHVREMAGAKTAIMDRDLLNLRP